jgi:hypothetical protein
MILQLNLLSLPVATAASVVMSMMRWMSLQHQHKAAWPYKVSKGYITERLSSPERYWAAKTGSHCIVATLPLLTLRPRRTCCLQVQLHLLRA